MPQEGYIDSLGEIETATDTLIYNEIFMTYTIRFSKIGISIITDRPFPIQPISIEW
jgi:hypothetical protein